MIFFNLTFLLLFSLVPISLLSSEPVVRPVRSTQDSRDGSPTVEVRAQEGCKAVIADIDEYESALYYEFPGSRDVCTIQVKKEKERRSFPISNTQIISCASHSLPKESKLEKMVASTPTVPKVLSESTERFNFLSNELATVKEMVTKLLNQSKDNSENPSK